MKFNLDDIKRLLKISKHYNLDDEFFPSDLIPHSPALKYACKKLHEQGLLERSSDCGRWGYTYKIRKDNLND